LSDVVDENVLFMRKRLDITTMGYMFVLNIVICISLVV
jgi:hypothetical protein